jgi:alkylation response protein AidB-like acyl-CoA dehydrogenase
VRALNEDEVSLRDTVRAWISTKSPVSLLREVRDQGYPGGYAPEVFRQAVDLGWTAAVIPEEFGGLGLGMQSVGLVMEELGRQLVPLPVGPAAQAATIAIALGADPEQKQRWLPRIAEGSAIPALAVTEGPRFGLELSTRAKRDGDSVVLDGVKTAVAEGMSADVLVVAARLDGGTEPRLMLVEADAAGLGRTSRLLMDSRGYADLTFARLMLNGDALMAGEAPDGQPLIDAVLNRTYALLAAEMLGLSQEAFDMTLEYLKIREQFGQVIGSFQALQHRMAELFSRIELVRPCVTGALQAIDDDDAEAPQLASLAKAMTCDLANWMTREMIQLHGGIAITDEFNAGFYIKRARVLEAAFGTASWHRARFACIERI